MMEEYSSEGGMVFDKTWYGELGVCVCVCWGGGGVSYIPMFKIASKILSGKIFCLSLS
jgi:hypothetical protein